MVSINDKHLIDFIFQINSCLTFEELNEWESKLSECSDEMIEYAFSDKAIDIVQLSDEYEQNYVKEGFITVDEYLSKHYSSAISLLLRLPNLKNELMDSKYNSNNKRFQIYQGNGHVATYAQQILYSLSNKYDLI
ncbi:MULTISPECIES: hypothetical protein [Enterococcus]|jgi:hypothetical protein|uniref:hypothetical protein n=1 Tax=Enterococcus TaxID=1350 RepID=UPI0003547914|nr:MULTISPECIES: hypothetical protein [Enterococcus]EPH92109.1 hypothetical protein D922_02523 [Enterococcus faecalis 06-MB-DW-09]WEI90899.1 hypothetical protein PZY29_09110 [Enterococcus casseliflavus]